MEPNDSNRLSDVELQPRSDTSGVPPRGINPLQPGVDNSMLMPRSSQQMGSSSRASAVATDNLLPIKPSSQGNEQTEEDVVWIERAKSIVAQTQGDPHKQAQLLQQLSALYLKERFGREVPSSKG